MAKRDILVVGASAGGVSVLKQLVKSFPKDFSASVFIVLHVPPFSPSKLPDILSSESALEAIHPKDTEKVEQGKIYVACPDHHLILEDDNVLVKKGPKENRFRPSIDALFRSAAYTYKERVIGVVLSGALDDGTSGLWTVKRMGGIAICQDPEEAAFPEMSLSVQKFVEADYILPISEMGAVFNKLVSEDSAEEQEVPQEELDRLALEIKIATSDNAFERGIMEMGEVSPFTCPSCNGALIRMKEDVRVRYRCHTGHAFTASALLAGISKSVEEILWQAMRGLEETSMLLRNIGDEIKEAGNDDVAGNFLQKAEETADKARTVHDSVFETERFSADLQYKQKEGK